MRLIIPFVVMGLCLAAVVAFGINAVSVAAGFLFILTYIIGKY